MSNFSLLLYIVSLKEQKFILGDILDKNTLENAIKGNQIVYNFAAIADLNKLIKNPIDSINVNSYLAIETRSKKGEDLDVVHGKTHFRNYTDYNYLKDILKSKNFDIIFIAEGVNMAIYKNENPICIRVICKKIA